MIVGILVVSIVGLASLFYFDSTKDHSQSIFSNCESDGDCLLQSLVDLSKNEDRETVLTTFSGMTTTIKQSGRECHVFGHHLGFFLYDFTENLDEALSLIERTCGGSIYHGVMQGYFATKSFSDNGIPTSVVASNACNELHDVSYSHTRTQCAHGVGHGLVIAHNYDVFPAFEECEVFEDEFAQRQCKSGVSMENSGIYHTPEGATFDEDDLLFPCSALDVKSAVPCLYWHLLYVMRTLNGSVEDAFEECEKNENETLVKYCYYGIGRTQIFSYGDNLEILIPICQKANLNYQTYCFAGLNYSLIGDRDLNRGVELCKLVPQMSKMDCYETLGEYIHTIYFTDEEIENACSQVNDTEYYQLCINANPEELGLV